jgi:hypothetical protein
MNLADAGKMDSAKKILHRYDSEVSMENVPYGMTSNRGNQHNRVSMSFLYAAYRAGDQAMAKKVSASVKRDLEQQMRYYRFLGDQLTDEQMASDAMNMMQGRANNISDKQMPFIQDIVSSYQMLQNLNEWEKQFAPGRPGATNEGNRVITNDTPK